VTVQYIYTEGKENDSKTNRSTGSDQTICYQRGLCYSDRRSSLSSSPAHYRDLVRSGPGRLHAQNALRNGTGHGRTSGQTG